MLGNKGSDTKKTLKESRAEIHQPSLSQFPLFVQFYTDKVSFNLVNFTPKVADIFQEQFDLLQTPAEASVFYRQFKKASLKLELSAYSQKIIEIQYEAKYVINEKVLPGNMFFYVSYSNIHVQFFNACSLCHACV